MDFIKNLYFFDRSVQFVRIGDSLWITLMIVGVYYIYCQRKESLNKAVVFPMVFYTIFVLNPLTSYVFSEKMGFSAYLYRLMWMFPVPLILGYAGIDLLERIQSKSKQIFIVAFIGVITFFAENVTSSVYLTQNIYKVQDELINVSKLLHEKEERIAVFFEEDNLFATSVQYDPNIYNGVDRDEVFGRISEAKKSNENLDTKDFCDFIREQEIEYFVLHKDTDIFQSDNYVEFVLETEKSKIYRLKD